ncbi:MAG: response regulator transcription factor [Solirubrobacterales bacterium]|nr:response regulator transcription factor [Solirubrobacterales bacterium]
MLAAGPGPVIRGRPRVAAGVPTIRRTLPLASVPVEARPRIAVVLADDHIVVRRGLRMLLERVPDFEVVAEAGDARAALDAATAERADILVLDLNMPGQPPLEVLSEVAESAPDVAVVVLTMEQDAAFARRALDRGARGYVLKRAVDEELVLAIRTAAAGGTHVSAAIETALAKPPEHAGPPDGLTEREVEVLRLIALGHTNIEIAGELSLSVRTVETHRMHIQQKLGVSSRPELVRYALDRRLI